MSAPITFAAPHAFLGARPYDRGAAFCVAGVPLDIGTTNRAGARDGPRAIRAAARMLTDGRHPETGVDPTALDLSDLGEFEIALGDIPESLRLIEAQALAQLVEDETNRRFTRLDDSEIEDVVNGWFEESGKVAARRGE